MTKQEYLNIKDAWARSVNNKDYMPYKDEKYGTKYGGKIKALHYLVYNIVRGLPPTRGFEPLGRGYEDAQLELHRAIKYGWEQNLLFPFENLVTSDMLKELVK